jgi:hypothetical protein
MLALTAERAVQELFTVAAAFVVAHNLTLQTTCFGSGRRHLVRRRPGGWPTGPANPRKNAEKFRSWKFFQLAAARRMPTLQFLDQGV